MSIRQVSLLTLALVLAVPAAHAVPRHDQMKVKAIRKNGKVVGAHISMLLMNDNGPSFQDAYVALVTPANRASLTRPQAIQPQLGKLEHQFNPVKGILLNQIQQADFKVMYDGTKFKSGDHLDVLSAWPGNGTDMINPHVFGAVFGASRPAGHQGDITLP